MPPQLHSWPDIFAQAVRTSSTSTAPGQPSVSLFSLVLKVAPELDLGTQFDAFLKEYPSRHAQLLALERARVSLRDAVLETFKVRREAEVRLVHQMLAQQP